MANAESTSAVPLSCELLGYSVLHLHASVQEKDEKIPNYIRPDIKFELGNREYKAFVLCNYAVENFVFNCGIEGDFRFGEAISNENMINAWFNACTMLYGIMRGVFSTSVNQAIHKSLFLPSVMMINEINNRIKEILKMKPGEVQSAEKKQIPDKPIS